MFMATAKKVVRKIKDSFRKTAKKTTKKKVVVQEMPKFTSCEVCSGRGLKDAHTLCGSCEGHGRIPV